MGRFHGVCNCLNEYFRVTTAHGLRRAGWAVKLWGKLFWLVGFAVAIAAFVVLCGFLLADFAKYPVKMAISSQSNDVIEFPAVTVCNLDGSTHGLNDSIVYCSFDGMICYPTNKFQPYHSTKYGSCFTFNSKDAVTKFQTVSPGRNYGLTLMLNVDRSEYKPTKPDAEGFRIAVHPSGSQPFPEVNGFSLPTHFEATISVRYVRYFGTPTDFPRADFTELFQQNFQNYVKKLGHPYSECTQMTLDDAGYNATSLTCEASCMAQDQDCGCKPLCRETLIDTQFTLSLWPSLNHEATIKNMLKTSTTWQGNLPNGGIDITQMAALTVYFTDFTTTNTTEKKAFSLPQLISQIGGLSALCIGFSVLTVFEFVEFILSMILAPMDGSKADSDRQSLASNSDQFPRLESALSTETAGNPPVLPRMSSTPTFAIQDFANRE